MTILRPCSICNESGPHKQITVQDMMFGAGDSFQYMECSRCGCLQLIDDISDPGSYYASDYYSMNKLEEPGKSNLINQFFKTQVVDYFITGNNLLGKFVANRKHLVPAYYHNWLLGWGITLRSRILDVGCGSGALLLQLVGDGFMHCTGIDPYIEQTLHYSSGLTIHKTSLQEFEGVFDFIMLNHSFEHMHQPLEALQHLYRLLSPQGTLLIRIPVSGTLAYRTYGPHWVQIDAPRHVFLHTLESLSILSEQTGFTLKKTLYDSTEFQFWGSEQYKQNIPLHSPTSYAESPDQSMFSASQIKNYQQKADDLNSNQDGDQACFYFSKS